MSTALLQVPPARVTTQSTTRNLVVTQRLCLTSLEQTAKRRAVVHANGGAAIWVRLSAVNIHGDVTRHTHVHSISMAEMFVYRKCVFIYNGRKYIFAFRSGSRWAIRTGYVVITSAVRWLLHAYQSVRGGGHHQRRLNCRNFRPQPDKDTNPS